MERNLVIKDVYGRVFASAASFTIKKEEMEKQAIWPLYTFPIKSINISIPELEVDDFGLNVKGKENEIIFEREKYKLAHVIHLYDTPLVVYESNRRDYKRLRSARDINTLTIEITDTKNKDNYPWFDTGFTAIQLHLRRNYSNLEQDDD